MAIPILIDTDIGSDIDDAFAIALALQSPEVEIKGVTTVFCNTDRRTALAEMLLKLAGRGDIPVHTGLSHPIVQREMFDRPIDFDDGVPEWLEEFEKYLVPKPHDAPQFIVETLEKAERPLVILTLGALTNIAAVLTVRPDLKKKIDYLMIMGGSYFMNYQEYNFSCDPEAAKIVTESGLIMKFVGLDITRRCCMGPEYVRKLKEAESPVIKALMKMARLHGEYIYLHDPLAMFCIVSDAYVTFEKALLTVETAGRFSRGLSVNLNDNNWHRGAAESTTEIAVRAEERDFAEECFRRIMRFEAQYAARTA